MRKLLLSAGLLLLANTATANEVNLDVNLGGGYAPAPAYIVPAQPVVVAYPVYYNHHHPEYMREYWHRHHEEQEHHYRHNHEEHEDHQHHEH